MCCNEIKIISNPYEKKIEYQILNGDTYENIADQNSNSDLGTEEFTGKFFPFKAEDILKKLREEYNGKIQLNFEGTLDEFIELKALCDSEDYEDGFVLRRGDVGLNNARDIWPVIKERYSKIQEYITNNLTNIVSSSEGKDEYYSICKKIREVLSPVINVCVMGNYSTGKSTFINALIGREILPVDDNPTTARVYKIRNSRANDYATVKFKYKGKDVEVTLDNIGLRFKNSYEDGPLIGNIFNLRNEKDQTITNKIGKILRELNKAKDLDNSVDIKIPFKGQLDDQQHDYVIFDTPGSNSDSHPEHLKVLQEAMEGYSCGMPVLVVNRNTADSVENRALCDNIKSLKTVDYRFTMIVCNRADTLNYSRSSLTENGELPAEKIEEFLNQKAINEMFASGVFFSSAVVGLGAKTEQEFENDQQEGCFEDVKNRFIDDKHKRYSELYKYNIMPKQIKRRYVDKAKNCADVLYANSGLYSIEQGIIEFAEKYSVYDKCVQSKNLIQKIIEFLKEETNKKKENSEIKNEELKSKYDGCSRVLIDKIENMKEAKKKECFERQDIAIENQSSANINRRKEYNTSDISQMSTFQKYKNAISDRTSQDLETEFKEFSKDLDDRINNDIDKEIEEIEKESWQVITTHKGIYRNELKNMLFDEDSVLPQEAKDALEKEIDFKTNEVDVSWEFKFEKEEFKVGILEFLNLIFKSLGWAFRTNDLDLERMALKINKVVQEGVLKKKENIKEKHRYCFELWVESINTIVKDELLKYNPDLKKLNNEIQRERKIIKDLDKKINELKNKETEILNLINWQHY